MYNKTLVVFGAIGVLCLLIGIVMYFAPSRFKKAGAVIEEVASDTTSITELAQLAEEELLMFTATRFNQSGNYVAPFTNTIPAVNEMCAAFQYAVRQSAISVNSLNMVDMGVHDCLLLIENGQESLAVTRVPGLVYVKTPDQWDGHDIFEPLKLFQATDTVGTVKSVQRASGLWSFYVLVDTEPYELLWLNVAGSERSFDLLSLIINAKVDKVMRQVADDPSLHQDCQAILELMSKANDRLEVHCEIAHTDEMLDFFHESDDIGRMVIQRRGGSESDLGGSTYNILTNTAPMTLLRVYFEREFDDRDE